MGIKKNLDIILYEKIIDSLIAGEYVMGQQILLDDLVEKFNVSRTPISQAAKLLNMDGILEIKSNGRLYVPSFDDQQVKEIVEVRLLLEKNALDMIDPDNKVIFKELEKSALLCEEYSNKKYLEMSKEDLHFHRILISGAQNAYLSDIYRKVQGKYLVASYLVLPPESRDQIKAVEEHSRLMDCLQKRDLNNAKAVIENHIYNIYNQMSFAQ